jgi:hypothetical protein
MVQFLVFLRGCLFDCHNSRSACRSDLSLVHLTDGRRRDGPVSGFDVLHSVRQHGTEMTAAAARVCGIHSTRAAIMMLMSTRPRRLGKVLPMSSHMCRPWEAVRISRDLADGLALTIARKIILFAGQRFLLQSNFQSAPNSVSVCEFAKMRTLYDTLEVRPDADVRDIRSAYLRQAKLYHPDKNFGDEAAGQQFNDLKIAYEFLRDDKNRKFYDAYLTNMCWHARQQKLRNGFIYAIGFVATFCLVIASVRPYSPNGAGIQEGLAAPVAAFSPLERRSALGHEEAGSKMTKRSTDADRHDPVIALPQIRAAYPTPVPLRASETAQPHFDRGRLNRATAVTNDNPSNAALAPASDRGKVRVWAGYRDDPVVRSQIPLVRVFTVEREGHEAGSKPAPVATVSSALPKQERDVRVRTTLRSSAPESEIRVTPHVVTVEREQRRAAD